MPSAKVLKQRRLAKAKAQEEAKEAFPPPQLENAMDPTAGFGTKTTAQSKIIELERRDEIVCQEVKDRVQYAAEARPTPGVAPPSVPSEDKYKFDSFDDPNQRYVVVNFAHRDQRPKKERPAMRLLGAFATTAEADAYIQEAAPLLKGCNMWRLEIQKWMVICKSMARQQDGDYTGEKVETLKQIYLQDKARRDADFQKNRENKELGKTDLSLEKQKSAAAKKKPKKISTRLKALRQRKGTGVEVNANAELNNKTTSGTNDVPTSLIRRKQDYAVASFMKDVTKPALLGTDDPEPCCIIWRFFASDEMARAWMKGIGSKYIRDYDTEIVDNYEWLFPEDVDREKVEETWRHPEQNKIMLQSKSEPGRVAEFEQWCKSKNMEMPVTEVVAPDLPVTNQFNLKPKDIDQEIQGGEIKLPAPTFSVSCVETKHRDEAPVKIVQGLDSDYDYLRRPLQSSVADKKAQSEATPLPQPPRPSTTTTTQDIHAPDDD